MKEKKDKSNKALNIIVSILTFILSIICVLSIGKNILFTKIVVSGDSMLPTLSPNQYGLSLKSKYCKIKRGDILIISRDDDLIIKRVVGLPNDTISLDENLNIVINGEIYEEKYISSSMKKYNFGGDFEIGTTIVLGKDEYFCLGDNRKVSLDSRYIGPIKKENIKSVLKVTYASCENYTCKNKDYELPKYY